MYLILTLSFSELMCAENTTKFRYTAMRTSECVNITDVEAGVGKFNLDRV